MTLQSNTEQIRQIEAATAPSRFARGWHCLGLTKDFGDGEPHGINAFGRKLVVFRSGDGVINIFDLSYLLSAWGTNNAAIANDLGHSGPVNIIDLSILLSHWGS